MGNLDGWDTFVLVAVGYLATMALVRLMLARRRQIERRLFDEAEAARREKPAAKPRG